MDSGFNSHSFCCVTALGNAAMGCDASANWDQPGFVKILNDKQLLLPESYGSRLFHGYGSLETYPKIGLDFLISGHDHTARISGPVSVVEGRALNAVGLEVFNADEKAEILQGFLMDVEESYGCWPRALEFSKLWVTEDIVERNDEPTLAPKESGI